MKWPRFMSWVFEAAPKAAAQSMRCRSGMAATEFALLLPIQVLLFFGLMEAADALTVNRRVALASNMLADLVAQSKELTVSEVDGLFAGVREILDPNAGSALSMKIVSVEPDPRGDPIVHWSRDESGAVPYTPGSAFSKLKDATVLTASSSLIVAEITYDYKPTLAYKVFSSPLSFQRQTARWPRQTIKVQLCKFPGVGCTT